MNYEVSPFQGTSLEELRQWIQEELRRIQSAIGTKLEQEVDFLSAPPQRIREGLIVGADGTNWDPLGSGKGLYVYRGGAWRKLD